MKGENREIRGSLEDLIRTEDLAAGERDHPFRN
jgi:hypothetical protein